jgi:hypothetical protein
MKNLISISLLFTSLFVISVAVILIDRIFGGITDKQLTDWLGKAFLTFLVLYVVGLLLGVMTGSRKK